ncbi:hypothetical protein QQF64_002027 [Cirrhinus molitorella]|uniref:Uncharacterized protein n=1 Tax=Cirrhinus molitorella TaxID=172907 RepID=A0ABR3MP02_9TELE
MTLVHLHILSDITTTGSTVITAVRLASRRNIPQRAARTGQTPGAGGWLCCIQAALGPDSIWECQKTDRGAPRALCASQRGESEANS